MRLCARAVLVCLLALVNFTAARAGDVNLGVGFFQDDGAETSKEISKVLSYSVQDAILAAMETAPCELTMVEVKRRADVEAELALQQSGAVDPAKVGSDHPTPVTVDVTGRVTADAEIFTWEIKAVRLTDGKVLAEDSGTAPGDSWPETSDAIGARLVGQLCHPPYQVSGGMEDLVISAQVCDLDTPFTLTGSGETAGLSLALTPTGEGGGSWTVGGSAGGVPWDGGGTYSLSLEPGGGGRLELSGSWAITSPVGRFGYGGTIPTTLTPTGAASCAG